MEEQTDFPLPQKEIKAKNETKSSILTSKFFILFVIISSLIAFIIGGFVLGTKNSGQKACTLEAKICPDGSSVSRTGPNCEFSKCPSADQTTNWKTYTDPTFSIKYPVDYQLNINKIVATEGIIEPQANTIQLISPVLPSSTGNLSIIIAYKATKLYLEEAVKQGSTCAELSSKILEPIKIGNSMFSQSGLINCGPNAVAFFYVLNNGNIYEAKVETTADFENNALPVVKQILATLKFIQ